MTKILSCLLSSGIQFNMSCRAVTLACLMRWAQHKTLMTCYKMDLETGTQTSMANEAMFMLALLFSYALIIFNLML